MVCHLLEVTIHLVAMETMVKHLLISDQKLTVKLTLCQVVCAINNTCKLHEINMTIFQVVSASILLIG